MRSFSVMELDERRYAQVENLDDHARAVYVRGRNQGMRHSDALQTARDDMEIRERVAKKQGMRRAG